MLKKVLAVTIAIMGALTVTIAALLMSPLPSMPDRGLTGDFIIRHVDVIDVTGGQLWRDRDVVVRQGLVASVEPAASAFLAGELVEIDGRGRFLIPGLWDMHTHSSTLAPQYYHPLLIANGVTGVREMWGCMSEPESFVACIDDRRRWTDALEDHSGLSPRFISQSSFQINGGNEVPEEYPEFFKVLDENDASQIAAFYAAAGADFLKIYSELPLSAYRSLADQARRHGLFLAGHRPLSVSLEEMLAVGQKSVEHPRLFLFECYRHAATFRALRDPMAAYDEHLRQRLVDEHDAQRCKVLMREMANSATWWVPTLQVLKMSAYAGDESFRRDRRLNYIPYLIREGIWLPDANRAASQATPDPDSGVFRRMYRMALGHVGQAHAAGIKILVGTDAGDTYIFPGFSVHDELGELVAAGLSPLHAIRAATIESAVFGGVGAVYGSIEVGKVADMILLDDNPLADIRHTRKIRGLFFNGRFYDRAALDQLLDFVESQASSIQTNLHLLWAALSSPIVRVQLAD
jgi:hypothetical protein